MQILLWIKHHRIELDNDGTHLSRDPHEFLKEHELPQGVFLVIQEILLLTTCSLCSCIKMHENRNFHNFIFLIRSAN